MTPGGLESIGPILEHAKQVAQEVPDHLNQFQQVMDQLEQTQQTDQLKNVQIERPEIMTKEIGSESDLSAQKMVDEKVKMAKTPEGLKMLGSELEQSYTRLNEIVKNLQSGKSYSTQEILGIQGEMHNLSLQIEVTTKVVAEAVSGLKQLMQQQV